MKVGTARRSVALATLFAAGCMHHRGAFAARDDADPGPGVTIAIIGNTGGSTRDATAVADRLGATLDAASGRHSGGVVVWLGNAVGERPYLARRPASCHRDGSSSPIARAVRARTRAGTGEIAVAGPAEWQCRVPPPWPANAHVRNGVVAIDARGRVHPRVRCHDHRCEAVGDRSGAIVELVLVDLWPWLHPDGIADADGEVAAVEALMDQIATDEREVSRLLVLHYPAEGALEHGLGAISGGDATFHALPPSLHRELVRGAFTGVLAGGEHGLYVVEDLAPIVMRTDKVWLSRPLWQLVSGTAGGRGSPARRSTLTRGVGYEPATWSDHPGFAFVTIADGRARVGIDARVRGRWQRVERAVTLNPPARGSRATLPGMNPCVRCRDVPANERP